MLSHVIIPASRWRRFSPYRFAATTNVAILLERLQVPTVERFYSNLTAQKLRYTQVLWCH
jgi:hypothetical protein